MNMRTIVTAAALVVGTGSSVLAEIDVNKLPPAATKTGVTYEQDIKPLFDASCVNCHGERRQRAGLRLDSREAVLQGSDDGKVVEIGNSKESLLVHCISQLDDEIAMPPKRGGRGGLGGPPPGVGGGGPGRAGAGPGGPGGRGGGFNPLAMLAGGLFTQADANQDHKLSKTEFTGLAGTWFEKLDTQKTDKLSQEAFSAGMDDVLPAMDLFGGGGGRGRGPGGQRGGNEGMGFGLGRMVGPAFFSAGDADKNDTLTRTELSETFGRWYTGWDTNKTDALTVEQFRDGFATAFARNPGRRPGGAGGPGGFGGGGGGFPGFPFGRSALAQQMVTQGDADKNEKLSKAEFMAITDVWFDRMDAGKAGKLSQDQFSGKLAEALGLPPEPTPSAAERPATTPTDGAAGRQETGGRGGVRTAQAGGGPGGPGGGGVAAMGPGLFGALDADKDGSLTRPEVRATFEQWFASFDKTKSGSLDGESLYAGLREILPGGLAGGFGGFGGFPGGRGGEAAPIPLTAEQVGLVRAWIDQGAK
jgi:hypothetical protein